MVVADKVFGPVFLSSWPGYSSVMTEVELPPERVEDKFKKWEETYAVENLEELPENKLQSQKHLFEAKVKEFKAEYNPGRLVTPEMAQIAGKEPLTQNQFRRVRRMIDDEADKVRMNFERAIGRRREKETERRNSFFVDLAGRVSDSLTNVSVSFELPKLR